MAELKTHPQVHVARGENPEQWLMCGADATRVDVPCGCRDLHYPCGFVDREHQRVVCDGKPAEVDRG